MASSVMDVDLESLSRKVIHKVLEQAWPRVHGLIEELVQEVLQEVLAAVKLPNPRTSFNYHDETSQGIRYQLVFPDKLGTPIYTLCNIETEMGGPVKIELVDTIRKAIVTSDTLSSMKIEIVVLHGDLGFDDQGNWTEQEFNAKVVVGRENKAPLVIGNIAIALTGGVGIINDLKFTDNSSWTRCRKFRLGARVMTSNSAQGRIKEAISSAFDVKEHVGKKHEKHDCPSLDDDIWRLKMIKKDGVYHKRLTGLHIHKVKDFLQMYENNSHKLKEVLNCGEKNWKTIVGHALACVDYEKPNAVDVHNYQPRTKRRCIQEPLVESKSDRAYGVTNLRTEPISNPTTAFSGIHMGSYHASTSSFYKDGFEDHNHQLQLAVEKNSHPMQPSDHTCGDYNTRMEGPQATCNEKTVTNLAYGMTSQNPMSTCHPVNVNLSCIQEPSDKSKNDWADDLRNLQAEAISTPTTGMHMGAHHASTLSTYQGGSEDHNHQLQLPVEKNNHLIQPFDPTRGDHNIEMEGLLQATCNEETITDLDCGMTSQDPMSTSPLVGIQSSDHICGDYNIGLGRPLATEGTVPSLAYGMTSQAPTSTSPSVTALGEHSSCSYLPWMDDPEACFIADFICRPFSDPAESCNLEDIFSPSGNR